jgi:hypothetical protein
MKRGTFLQSTLYFLKLHDHLFSGLLTYQKIFTFENPIIFLFSTNLSDYNLSGLCSGITEGGCTSHDIENHTRIINFWGTQYRSGTIFKRNVVHELSYAFNSILSSEPVMDLGNAYLGRALGGYAGDLHQWQFNESDTPSENFVDMFVGWVYDQWGNDPQGYGIRRSTFMNESMANYLIRFSLPLRNE